MIWAVLVGLLTATVFLEFMLSPTVDLHDVGSMRDDVPVALFSALGMLLVLAAAARPLPARLIGRPIAHPARWAAGLAVLTGVLCYAATFGYFPMSMDEVMADFDAAIFRQGMLVAEVAPEWRAFVPALQWQFRMEVPGHVHWASLYLPVNAAFRAVFGLLGDPDLAGPFWAVVSLAATYGVARRLWPERREAALVAVALLATSSQFLVTAATPFAMSAHLALNLVWLWLFLRGGLTGLVGALVVGFAASGLHQVIFHPLFVAPFVLTLWLERRWRPALVYTAAYGATTLFWISYWSFALPADAGAAPGTHDLGVVYFLRKALGLIVLFRPEDHIWMVQNILRFVTWQSLLAAPLAIFGAVSAWRAGGTLRALSVGLFLTLFAMWIVLPNQGFGWGYRYMHGLLGSLCLLGAHGWITAADRLGPDGRHAAVSVLIAGLVFSALALAPLRFVRGYLTIRPYAQAHAAIERTDVDVVLIDETGLREAHILPRNDPFLGGRPKLMMLDELGEVEVRQLCRTRSVALFERQAGEALGMPTYNAPTPPPLAALRETLRELRCAEPVRVGL